MNRKRRIAKGNWEWLENLSQNWFLIYKIIGLFLITVFLIGFFIRHYLNRSNKNETFQISHFVIPDELASQGFTGEVTASLFLEKIHELRTKSSSLRGHVPFLDETLLNPDIRKLSKVDFQLGGLNLSFDGMFGDLLGEKSKNLITSSILKNGHEFILRLKIPGEPQLILAENGTAGTYNAIVKLLERGARSLLYKMDPYSLAAYYLEIYEFEKSKDVGYNIVYSEDIKQWGYFIVGLSEIYLGNLEIADSVFRLALDFDPDFAHAKLQLVMHEFNENADTNLTFQKLKNITFTNGREEPYFQEEFAGFLYSIDRKKEADSVYKIAFDLSSTKSEVLVRWARIIAMDYSSEALAKFEEASYLDPLNSVVWLEWGKALAFERKHNLAIKMYSRAIEVNPELNKTFESIVFSLLKQGRIEESYLYFPYAVEFSPDNIWLWNEWGNCLYDEQKYKQALEKYKVALDIDSSNPRLLLNMRNTLYKLNRMEEVDRVQKKMRDLEQPFIF